LPLTEAKKPHNRIESPGGYKYDFRRGIIVVDRRFRRIYTQYFNSLTTG